MEGASNFHVRYQATSRAYDWDSDDAQKVAYTATHAESAVLPAGEYCLSPTTACYITIGAAPVAAASAKSMPIPAFACVHIQLPASAKISAVKVTDDGALYIMPVDWDPDA